ncbi:MAG: outer membrane protein assembly factor, partial [Polyangiaceae bacterium]|nr:outer membrane protein assembly factor [Polyangiaceae bacterium]
PAGFPLIAGSSDTGFQIGVVGTLSWFANGIKPYAWNQDLLLTVSLKGREGGGGIEIAQQAYQWNIDWPGLFGGILRINPQVAYTRTVNVGYFGLGNAASAAPPPPGTINPARFYEFINNVLYARSTFRIDFHRPYAALAQALVRYVRPETYAGSKLTIDEQARTPSGGPMLDGTRPLTLASIAGGFVYDSRDNEIYTRSGMFHQIGIRLEEGFPFGDRVRYAEIGAVLAGFIPLGRTTVIAGRLVADAQLGNVPFFDLLVAGPFQLKEVPGGSSGVRGVPIGRYLGPYKVVANAELRSLPWRVQVFGQHLRLGGNVFADTGRVFSAPPFTSLDGHGIGLKYGVGLGGLLLWGQAAIFRLEVAYSPDAAATSSVPLGVYVEDGTMF